MNILKISIGIKTANLIPNLVWISTFLVMGNAGAGDLVWLVKYLSTKHVNPSMSPINYVKMHSRTEWLLQFQHCGGETRCLGPEGQLA